MFKSIVLGCFAFAGISINAAADLPASLIKSYNAAIANQNSTEIVAAAQALAAAVVADPAAPDAGLIAFETATQLCLRGACASASEVAHVAAAASGADLAPKGDRQLVAAYAAWSAKPEAETTAAFDAMLVALSGQSPTSISVAAFNARYMAEVREGSADTLSVAARRAADHLRPGRDVIAQYWSAAEMTALASAFSATTDPEILLAMYDLEYWLCDLYCNIEGERPDWLLKAYYTAMAWRLSTEAYIRETEPKSPTLRAASAKAEIRLAAYKSRVSSDSTDLPFCKGEFYPALKPAYPPMESKKAMFGAIVVGVAVADGKVGAPSVFAAVPSGKFEQTTLEAFEDVRWKFDMMQPEPCDRSTERVVVPFVYQLD